MNNKTNPLSRKEDLTLDELRSRKRFKDYSDERLENLLHTIKSFTKIAYNIWSKNKSISILTHLSQHTRIVEMPISSEQQPFKRKAA